MKEVQGNILFAEVDAVVNPVNCKGVMGAGLALQFKQTYIENFNLYKWICDRGEMRIGECLIFNRGEGKAPRYIVNFPTKDHWQDRSEYFYIEQGLADLAKRIKRLKITSIAIPHLGCGLGGLAWVRVRPMVEEALGGIEGLEVKLYGQSEPTTQRGEAAAKGGSKAVEKDALAWTSYFGSIQARQSGKRLVAISRGVPGDFIGERYIELAPSWELLKEKDHQRYTRRYISEVLDKLDPAKVATDLAGAILLCWEAPGKFCHRRIVAEWLEKKVGGKVPEFGAK